jgi:hypothetical protein
MTMPGFTAELSLSRTVRRHWGRTQQFVAAKSHSVLPQAFLTVGGFGGFGPTLPTCHWEKRWVECGSALPGYPVPMCLEWVYVCTFPGSSRNVLL